MVLAVVLVARVVLLVFVVDQFETSLDACDVAASVLGASDMIILLLVVTVLL